MFGLFGSDKGRKAAGKKLLSALHGKKTTTKRKTTKKTTRKTTTRKAPARKPATRRY